jgi:hypothetical protein
MEPSRRPVWGVEDLASRPKGDAYKVRIAARLRRETTITLAWIAEQLHMGVAGPPRNAPAARPILGLDFTAPLVRMDAMKGLLV